MIRSLAMKLGLLAATVGILWWVAWQAPDSLNSPASVPDEPAPVAVEVSATSPSLSTECETQVCSTVTPVQKSREVGPRPHVSSSTPVRSSVPVDLNRADAKMLESLPGIGAVLAQRVLEYRASVGQFHAVEELLAVKGIGPKTLERIRPFVMIPNQGSGDQTGKKFS